MRLLALKMKNLMEKFMSPITIQKPPFTGVLVLRRLCRMRRKEADRVELQLPFFIIDVYFTK
jgi:hypothetical protein